MESCAHVAQLAEHVLGKDEVMRSIRVVGSICHRTTHLFCRSVFYRLPEWYVENVACITVMENQRRWLIS